MDSFADYQYSQNFKSRKLIEALREKQYTAGQLTQIALLDILLAEVQVPHFE